MNLYRKHLFFAALLVAAALAVIGLQPRLREERASKTVAFVAESKDIIALAYQSGMTTAEVLGILGQHGVMGVTVMEYTGEELINMNMLPLKFGSAGSMGIDSREVLQDIAVVSINSNSPYVQPVYEYLNIKLPFLRRIEMGGETLFILPGTVDHFRQSAFIPDFHWLEICARQGINILFRPGPCSVSDGDRVARAMDWLMDKYPLIKCIVPSGAIMAGYPDLAPLAKIMKKHKAPLALVEFVKQIGVSNMAYLMVPEVLPLHSLTTEEVVSRRMPRLQIMERFARAAHERSIRLLLVRPYDLQMGNRLAVFTADLESVRREIEGRGYSLAWPETSAKRAAPLVGAFACAISFLFCAWFYATRILGIEDGRVNMRELMLLCLLSLAGAGILLKVPAAARLAGGLGAALAATEAALAAMSNHRKIAAGLVSGLFIVIACGLSIACYYGTTMAALRLAPFSGVKLTLLLPPLLILLHDFRRKIHPESISDIAVRPAVWGELILIGIIMLALLVTTLRSDNFSSVPAWETAFRDFMERTLMVRPRTKEFLVGYPALIVYCYLMRKGWATHYREALRIGASLAFASAINTFCHFHTMLTLSVVRVVNGWWIGILVGLAAVAFINYVGVPLWKRGLREVFR